MAKINIITIKKISNNLIWGVYFLHLFTSQSFSQSPGMIYESATGAGITVLDPDGNGYTSQSTTGFTTDDQTQSEINYISFILPSSENEADLCNGPNCSYTDFVDAGDLDAVQRCLSVGKWKFRLRMAKSSPNAKSYSILIDTDGLFGNLCTNADPDYTIYNPGFEIEIVLATSFGVYVYNVNTPNCTPVISYPGTTNYQKSVALTTNCGDADYFLDFYVNFCDLASVFGITTSTGMRYAAVSNTSSSSSTICNSTSISDIAGVGTFTSMGAALTEVIDVQGPCAPDGTGCLMRSDAPVITSSLITDCTIVSGTSTEANGAVIDLYKNGVSIGSTTVTAGAWTISGLAAFVAGDQISVTATASGEAISLVKCNTITVTGNVCTPSVITAYICNDSDKALQGIATAGATIRLYDVTGTLVSPTSGTTWNAGSSTITATTLPSTLSPTTDNFLWKCSGAGASNVCGSGGSPCVGSGNFYVTAQSAGQCESQALWICNDLAATTATPTITTTITTATTSVSGTIPSPDNTVAVKVYLYKNNILIGSVSTSTGSWTISGLSFASCDLVKAMAIRTAATAKCFSVYSTVQTVSPGTTSAPVIIGSYCTSTTITTVNGISSETDGTTIQVYDNDVAVGSSTTVTNGSWSVSGLNITPGHTITAKATKTSNCSLISVASDGVVVYSQSSSASLVITTNPIVEQSSTVSGTYITDGSTVQLFLDGMPIGSPATVAGGVWSVTGLASYYLTVGGSVTADVTLIGGCSSTTVSGGIVVCIIPSVSLTVTPVNTTLVTGTALSNIQVFNSESAVTYQLYLADETTKTGTSVQGNGGTITMTSGILNASTILKIKAIKVSEGTCEALLDETIAVTVVLPIELLFFSGKKVGNCNEIQWRTLTEMNNDFFTIEKTVDGINYDLVGKQDGAGNSSECHYYFLLDNNIKSLINYYRLKQTDYNGESKYCDPISIDNRVDEKIISEIRNILGEEVNEFYRGIVIIYYTDGSILKTIQ